MSILEQDESTFLKMRNKKKIICIGSLGWDYIAITNMKMKFGNDLPGQITKKPGGVAGNIARAISELSRFGDEYELFLMSATGNDSSSEELKKALNKYNINCNYLITNNGTSDQYVAIESCGQLVHAVSDNGQLIRSESKIIETLIHEDIFKSNCEGLLILDTNLSEKAFDKLSKEKSLNEFSFVVVSASSTKARSLNKFFRNRPTTLYSNLEEAQIISNRNFNGTEDAAKYLAEMGATSAIVTDGGNQVSSFCPLGLASIKPKKSKNITATGAGDFFLAAHLLSKIQNPGYCPEKHLINADATTRQKLKLRKIQNEHF